MAASKKPAAKKAVKKTTPKKEKVTLSPAEEAKRKRKALFLELVEHGLSIPKELRDEFAPSEEDDTPAPAPVSQEDKVRIIRNLRGIPVHLRLGSANDPYRVALEPRGEQNDIAEIPERLAQGTTFSQSYRSGLFEVITQAEREAVEYGPMVDRRGVVDPLTGEAVQVLPSDNPNDGTVAEYAIETERHGRNAGNVTRTDVIAPRQVYVPGSHPSDDVAGLLKAPEGVASGDLRNKGVGGSTAMPGTLPTVVRD